LVHHILWPSAILNFGFLGTGVSFKPYRWGYLELGIYGRQVLGFVGCFYMFTSFFAIKTFKKELQSVRETRWTSTQLEIVERRARATWLLFAIRILIVLKKYHGALVLGQFRRR